MTAQKHLSGSSDPTLTANSVPASLSGRGEVAKHTPGPWEVSGGALRIFGKGFGGGAEWVATVEGATPENGLSPTPVKAAANAARIVACVNACEGIADPAFFRTNLVGLLEESYNARLDALRSRVEVLEAALRESDAALAEFQDDAVCDHPVGICWCAHNRIREANRKALGSQP